MALGRRMRARSVLNWEVRASLGTARNSSLAGAPSGTVLQVSGWSAILETDTNWRRLRGLAPDLRFTKLSRPKTRKRALLGPEQVVLRLDQ